MTYLTLLDALPCPPQAFNEARHLSSAADAFAADLLVEAVAWAKPDGPGASGLGAGRGKQHLRTDHLDFRVSMPATVSALHRVALQNKGSPSTITLALVVACRYTV